MHGNVAEWCQDVYDPGYYKASPEKNPRGPDDGNEYVLRGGSWKSAADALRSAYRIGESPGFSDACLARDAIGFRCVRKPAPPRRMQHEPEGSCVLLHPFEATMLFHTWVFFVFFLIVYPVYLLVRRNNQLMNIWLMIASYTFYGWWNPWYLLLLFGTSAIDYVMVLLMERSRRTRTFWLVISLVSNFGFLGYFKYSGFLTENLNTFLAQLGLGAKLPDPIAYPNAMLSLLGVPEDRFFTRVILPIGISFHTFQSMSYTIDAYNGVIPDGAQLRALPDVRLVLPAAGGRADRARPTTCCRSSSGRRRSRRQDLADGLSLFLVGLLQEGGAGRLPGPVCRPGLRQPRPVPGAALVAGDAGVRLADLLRLQRLHRHGPRHRAGDGLPADAQLQQPLLGHRPGRLLEPLAHQPVHLVQGLPLLPAGRQPARQAATYSNMFLTMFVSGIWHGAAWTFVVWGGLHALGRCLTRELEQTEFYRERVPRLVKQLAVFTFVTLHLDLLPGTEPERTPG